VTDQMQFGGPGWKKWDELDERVAGALRSNVLNEREKEVLRVIAGHKGAANAIRAQEVAQRAGMQWEERARREIAGVVETCVLLFRVPIGGLRMKPYGYFLIVNADDLDLAIGPLWSEVYAHIRRLRALTSKQQVARLFGQAMLKLDAENPEKAA